MPLPVAQKLVAFLQQKILFRPVRLPADYRFQFDQPFEEVWVPADDAGVRLNALFFPAPQQPARGVVLYFHGNRDNLQRWGRYAADFTRLGYDFLAPDYRGYGKTPGFPDEKVYCADAERVYRYLCDQYPPEKIVLYGRSLGSGLATYLAARVSARMLILETPFDNIRSLMASHLRRETLPFEPVYHFPNDRHLDLADLPVLIFHGTRDRVVPFASAAKLRQFLNPDDEFVTINGGAHNNLDQFALYHERLKAWL
ncbi:MAG: alpha/beta fold hydrolase [Saprospiraceae bacterium]|nr:alpha/beta fold hydrolase [Saprospiraceae bacterium]